MSQNKKESPSHASATVRSMEQMRAEFALGKIESIKTQNDETLKIEVRRHFNNLPALIRTNGLGQALAFFYMQEKDKKPSPSYRAIYDMVGTWLCNERSNGRVFHEHTDDVLTAITRCDMQHYMAAQNEALALLEWLKKFAIAYLPNKLSSEETPA